MNSFKSLKTFILEIRDTILGRGTWALFFIKLLYGK